MKRHTFRHACHAPCLGPVRRCLQVALLILPALAQADITLFHCIDPDAPIDGHVTAWIGYANDSNLTVTIGAGPNNYFSPPPAFRGQPSEFLPGVHERVFSIVVEPVSWDMFYIVNGVKLKITLGLEDYCSSTVNALVVAPSGVLFAGMAEAGVFRSTDGGVNWYPVNDGLGDLHVHALKMHPDDSSILFAGTDEGVYKSVDGGDTWQALNSGLPGFDTP